MAELESGAVKNETKTTYKGKDKDGNQITEVVTKNKDTGEVTREVNGKKVDEPEKQVPKIKPIVYQQSNFEPIVIKQLSSLLSQLTEMNYYMAKIAKEDKELPDFMKGQEDA